MKKIKKAISFQQKLIPKVCLYRKLKRPRLGGEPFAKEWSK